MRQIMTGQCTDAQVGGFFSGLCAMKSESIDEICLRCQVLRELAEPVAILVRT